MRKRISLELDSKLLFPSDVERDGLIRQILRDALYEFISRRQPARRYVEERYRDQDHAWREDKILAVGLRVRIAEVLHASDVEITSEPQDEYVMTCVPTDDDTPGTWYVLHLPTRQMIGGPYDRETALIVKQSLDRSTAEENVR